MEAFIQELTGAVVMTGIIFLKFIGYMLLLCATYVVGRWVADALRLGGDC